MDIVYVCRRGESNEALRYSLRSLQNIPHDKVWIAGHKPRWVKNVRHVQHYQMVGGPLLSSLNTTAALYKAAVEERISNDFMYFNDDFYVMKPVEDVPLYHRGPIEKLYPIWGGKYRQGAIQTQQLLRRLGHNFVWSYELHIPIVLNKKKLVEVLELCRHEQVNFRLHKRTFYATYWGMKGEYMQDVKVRNPDDPFDKDSTYLSSAASTWHHDLGRFVRAQFTEKSPYEI